MLATSPLVRTMDLRLVLSLAAVYVIWSSTYLAMQIAIVELPPFLMASLRFAAAGLVLLLVALRRGAAWPRAADWVRFVPIGALMFVGGNAFVALALRSVSSGGAAVVVATMPLWLGVLGSVTGARPTAREWASLGIGFVGVLVLMGGPSLAGDPVDIALLVAAPICWALGSLLARRTTSAAGRDPFLSAAMQMLTGGAALALVAAAAGERLPATASASTWLALAYLWLFGSVIAFTAYNWLLRNAPPVVATSYAYVNPSLALVIGAALAGEAIGITTLAANVLIVVAIVLALRRRAR